MNSLPILDNILRPNYPDLIIHRLQLTSKYTQQIINKMLFLVAKNFDYHLERINGITDSQIKKFRYIIKWSYNFFHLPAKFLVSKYYHKNSILAKPITKFGKVFENHNPDLLYMCDLVLPILKYFYDKCGVNLDDTNIDNITNLFANSTYCYLGHWLFNHSANHSLEIYIKKSLSNKNFNKFPEFEFSYTNGF